MHRLLAHLLLAGLWLVPTMGHAVLFYSTGDPSYNTNAPTGALEGSGWQFQGRFRNTSNDKYLGTPIAPHHFITAKHISVYPSVGEPFYFNGLEYTTIAKINDSGSDLTLWEIDGTFSNYAPIYSKSDEVGKDLVVFGRGTQRGDAVLANGSTKGWEWGAKDFVMRWGENRVDAATTVNGYPVLQADFDSTGGINECMLSDKDSGGGLFIDDGGVWKLAGINYTVFPSSFSYSATGIPAFNAAMFDYSFWVNESEKVYYHNGSVWTLYSATGSQPCSFYSTRISARYSWITNNIPDFDRDVDGLPDWWETLYAGDATSMVATNDSDGDGFSNYEEWLADTVPTNGNSFLEIKDESTETNLVFSSSTNRQYQVQYRTNLVDSNELWQTEADWFAATNSPTVQLIVPPVSNRFYRVRATLR